MAAKLILLVFFVNLSDAAAAAATADVVEAMEKHDACYSSEVDVTLLQMSMTKLPTSPTADQRINGAAGPEGRMVNSKREPCVPNHQKYVQTQAEPVTIVMADSRSPSDADWIENAALINLKYSKRHNYNFSYLTYESPFCDWHHNDVSTRRHPAWCKLLAIKHVADRSAGNGFLIWMDSDAVFNNHELTVDDFLIGADLQVAGTRVERAEASCLKKNASVFFNSNMPGGYKPNSGVMFWRLPLRQELLSDWWASNVSANHRQWEQDGLWEVYPKWQQDIGVFDIPAFEDREGQYIRHVTETIYQEQYVDNQSTVLGNISANLLSQTDIISLVRELNESHATTFPRADMQAVASSLEQLS